MKLYINDRYIGECERYYQKRDYNDPRWVFVTNRGLRHVSFKAIKSFTYCGELRIRTNVLYCITPDTVDELVGGVIDDGVINGKILSANICSHYQTLDIMTMYGRISLKLDSWGYIDDDGWKLEKNNGKYYISLR